MLKNFLMYALFIAICFLIPSFFVDFSKVNTDELINKNEQIDEQNNVNEENIKLLLSESNKVISLSLDDYIVGVLLRRNACYI